MRHSAISIMLLICAALFSCTGGGGRGGVPTHDVMPVLVDKTLPTIISTSPASTGTATGVAADAVISAKFSEEMDASSITTDTLFLTSGGTKVPGSVSYNAATAVFTPSTALLPGTSYVAVMTTGAKDVSGNALEKEFTWTFSTAVAPDTTATGMPAADTATTDTLATDATVPDTTATDATVPAMIAPDATVPDTTVPDVTPPTIPPVLPPITNAPSARYYHTAIWTGTEMIVWGGYDFDIYGGLNTGGRYDPLTNAWAPTSTIGAPSARYAHTAVWTGTEMIVWGGVDVDGFDLNTGGRYNPATNTWKPISTVGAPSARYAHTAIWTGTEMIVWGGSGYDNTGGRYDPEKNTWKPVATINAPSARWSYRWSHTAIWTGTEMIVWGGYDGSSTLNTGGMYNPATDAWTATPTANAPLARREHTAIWTGTEMIVWGGYGGDYRSGNTLSNGGKYNPVTKTWTVFSTINEPIANEPSARYQHTAIWTGTEMIVWGGYDGRLLNTGGRYDPLANAWTATPITDAPPVRYWHTAIWTGTEMIVWGGRGGRDYGDIVLRSGGKYNPVAKTWTVSAEGVAPDIIPPTITSTKPVNLAIDVAIATVITATFSEAMDSSTIRTSTFTLAGGGSTAVAGTVSYEAASKKATFVPLASFAPNTTYTATITANVKDVAGNAMTEGYTWSFTTSPSIPLARNYHTAIWTGTEMIVWGGCDNNGYGLSSGGRYDPAINTWRPTSTKDAPSARYDHTAVWTGTEMIVWGGGDYLSSSNSLDSGGKYNPVTDTWTPISSENAPSSRYAHTAIWTGTEMIVWGGSRGYHGLTDTGGRYDPVTDIWKPISATNVPLYRYLHTAVWTGTDMIVWGGYGSSYLSSGGKYNPMTNTWKATSITNAPSARYHHTAIWTGTDMIVWGGSNASIDLSSGAMYNPATDTWTLISTNAPSARAWHTAIWTGTEMIVWGGKNLTRTGGSGLDSGGKYNPATNTWIATSTTSAPSVRSLHTAIWTGTEMMVWGGSGAGHLLNSGGKYNPETNTWAATFTENIP